MPTAITTSLTTTTTTSSSSQSQPSIASLKAATATLSASAYPNPSDTTTAQAAATLRTLYPRAAQAFLQRNVHLTHSLINSAFAILAPPPVPGPNSDALVAQRKKWDILRITFETTLYSSPPPSQNIDELPSPLRSNLLLSPEPLIATLHNRSLALFTPKSAPQKPTSAFLPAQILVTLALASLKLDCAEVGRGMIEDWLARHGQEDNGDAPDGYAKVLELYCLHVLPRLEEWDYAEDFLLYERELKPDTRTVSSPFLFDYFFTSHMQYISLHERRMNLNDGAVRWCVHLPAVRP